MRTLKENDYKMFEHLVSLSQPSLFKTMETFLKRKYETVVVKKEYMYAVGDIPITLVAHLDTVFACPVKTLYYDQRKNVLWSPDGLGADDRAGVFAIIKIIRAGFRPHIIFTTDEERGGIGASALIRHVPVPFADMKYIIQLDRRGSCDCVFYDCDNPEFVKYVEQFGFVESVGSYSDISEICPKWQIAGVNLSVGYINEHSYAETLHLNHFFATVDKVIKMLKSANEAPTFIYIPHPHKYSWSFPQESLYEEERMFHCYKCKKSYSEYELFPVLCLDGNSHFYCPDCLVDNVNWCADCGDAFEIKDNTTVVCGVCNKGVNIHVEH
jgi:hypothetical protein